jgi:N-methylhydantoinase A
MLIVGVDVGGTFTDLVFYDSQTSSIHVVKVPTTVSHPEEGVIASLASIREKSESVSLVYHATTIATNALLTREGLAHTALITNHGFRDVLEIGRQRRPELYNLTTDRPIPLVPRKDRYTVRGRILADGSEKELLEETDLRKVARKIVRLHYDSVAISFLNSYVNPKHEIRTREELTKNHFKGSISISSEVNPEYREYERTSTTVVNSVLTNRITSYLTRLEKIMRAEGFQCPFYVMQSDGTASTMSQATLRPISLIESGPAAGVLASQTLARLLRLPRVITFDMGGTTAKASALTNGRPDISYEFEAASKTYHGRSLKGSGYPVRQPFIDLAEVSSGGGTIAWLDETGVLKLGPQSAGSNPGPAAYGKGGRQPTVTDANILAGRINPKQILSGLMKMNYDMALMAVTRISTRLRSGVSQTVLNILRIANNNMAKALALVSLERGRDPRDYVLVAFGGAGPLHACELASELGIKRIIVPLHPGMFSALGLLTAELSRTFSQPVMKPATRDLESSFRQLRALAHVSLKEENFESYKSMEEVDLRYHGQAHHLTVPYRKNLDMIRLFTVQHKKLYGYSSTDSVEVVNARLRTIIHTSKPRLARKRLQSSKAKPASERRVILPDGNSRVIPIYEREHISAGTHGTGPCVVEEYDSTTMIDRNWKWKIDALQNIDMISR